MKNILFTIYTEYQLILALNEIFINNVYNIGTDKITFIIKHEKAHNRMDRPLNIEGLGIDVIRFDDDINFKESLSKTTKNLIDNILTKKWDDFILFQENDPLNCLLSFQLNKKGTVVRLYQDGLKAYNPMKSRSYGQLLIEIKQRVWWFLNGYKSDPLINVFSAFKYGFLKGVSKIHVTFPEKYDNWNKKQIEKILFNCNESIYELIKKVFLLENKELKLNEDVVFFISQSMRDDNVFESSLLDFLIHKFPDKPIYIKSHPTQWDFYRAFIDSLKERKTKNLIILDEKIPAEFYIMQLKKSILVSTASTSMLLNNESCRYFFTIELAKPYMPLLNRYSTTNPTKHVLSIENFDQIV